MRFGRLVLLRPADLELDVLDSLEHAHGSKKRRTALGLDPEPENENPCPK